jgi:hypothetical protein
LVRHLVTDGVGGNDHQALVGNLLLVLIGELAIGLRRTERRPVAFDDEGMELGIGRQDVRHCLHALGAVVIGEHRAAGDLGPAAFCEFRLSGHVGWSLEASAGDAPAGADRSPTATWNLREAVPRRHGFLPMRSFGRIVVQANPVRIFRL